MSSSPLRLGVTAIVLTAAVFACKDGATIPTADSQSQLLSAQGTTGVADTGEFEVCKHGTFSRFRIAIDNTPGKLALNAEQCQVLATTAALGVGPHTVKVVEDAPIGTVLDSIVAESVSVRFKTPFRDAPITGTNQITRTFDGDQGWTIHFYNHNVP
jgi:hypothetical protein